MFAGLHKAHAVSDQFLHQFREETPEHRGGDQELGLLLGGDQCDHEHQDQEVQGQGRGRGLGADSVQRLVVHLQDEGCSEVDFLRELLE